MRQRPNLLLLAFVSIAALSSSPLRAAQLQSALPSAAAPVLAGPGVTFQLNAQQLSANFAAARQAMESSLEAILSVPARRRTFENTVKAFETANAFFCEKTQSLVFLAYVSPDANIRKAAQSIEVEADKYSVGLWSRSEIYDAVKQFVDRKEPLSVEDARLLESMMRDFKSSGHGLAPEHKAKLQGFSERLAELSSLFEGNINKDDGFMDVTSEQLKGLPDDYIQGLEAAPEGKYRVTLKYPHYLPFMKYAEDGAARRALELRYNNRQAKENVPLLVEALRLRHDTAKLLGYGSYPDMALDGRMAEAPAKVWAFLNKLWPILRVKGERELQALLAVKKRDDPAANRIESWELSYYSDKLRKEKFDLDSEEVKKYFPVDRVVEGTMKVYQRVLGLRFTEVPSPDVWHKEVRLFRINDSRTDREIGYFYLDLFPRQGKYSHAAAFTIIKGRELEDGAYRKPVSAMVANFPGASPGAPALMPHADVETFFHEFGHLMHQTLTQARYASVSGSSVARDFVEAPSQMLENFVWQREVLDEISGHHEDPGRKLPEELFARMTAARDFNIGLRYLKQLAYAMIDMVYHTAVPQQTTVLFNQMMELISLIAVQPGSHSEAAFGHLMGGYGAGYYGYLWSEVFAADIFTRFTKEGLFNPEVGRAWRQEVLEVGSSRPEMDSLRAFLGRQPSEKAFMDKLGGG